MPIETYSNPSFGNDRVYFKEEKLALAYTLLTGRKTLTVENKHALEVLGVQFEEDDDGR